MAEQRYQAVLAVVSDGLSVSQVAEKVGVSRQTLHTWLARYEAQGLEGLVDRSHRPANCPHQMPAAVEAALLELRRSRAYWGPRRLVFGLVGLGIEIDERRNAQSAKSARLISADTSPITVLVVPTNEELAIARDCLRGIQR